MRWVLLLVMAMFIAEGETVRAAHPAPHEPEINLTGPVFAVGGLQFTIPAKWLPVPAENNARAGQWHIPPSSHDAGDGGDLVITYFGPGIGGSPKENIEAWIGTMFNAEGRPAAAVEKHREAGGLKISQVVIFGTYNQIVSLPGIPPASKPSYGLFGVVIEGPKGNIYWRFTGPEPLITANIPLFNKIIDSVKPQDK